MPSDPSEPKPRPSTLRRVGCVGCGIVGVLLATGAGLVAWVIAQKDTPPEFYAERLAMPPARLESAARELESKIARLKSWPVPTADRETTAPAAVKTAAPPPEPEPGRDAPPPAEPPAPAAPPPRPAGATGPRWSITLTEDEINAYLANRLAADAPAVGSAGLTQPRIVLEPGRARIAFRVERPELTGIVSLTVRPVVREVGSDAVRLDVTAAHLGRVPLPLATLADQVPPPQLPAGFDLSWGPSDEGLTVEADWADALARTRGPKRHVDTLTLDQGQVTVGGYAEPPPKDATP